MWIIELRLLPTAQRLAARPAHRARLTELHRAGIVRMAGPLGDDSGAVIVVDAPDRAAVDSLIAADPYFATSGVETTQVREWRPFLH